MRYLILALISACTITLVGCTSRQNSYLKKSNTISYVIAPTGESIKQERSEYPIPKFAMSKISNKPPSMVPPGSNLQRFNKKKNTASTTAAQAEQKNFAVITQLKGKYMLIVAAKEKLLWSRVGTVLHKTTYEILDQDRAMGSYFILDSHSTANKITRNTPIYRIHLTASGSKTQISLLSQSNGTVNSSVAKRILTAIKDNLTY